MILTLILSSTSPGFDVGVSLPDRILRSCQKLKRAVSFIFQTVKEAEAGRMSNTNFNEDRTTVSKGQLTNGGATTFVRHKRAYAPQ